MCWTMAAYARHKEAKKNPMEIRAIGLSSMCHRRRAGYTSLSKIGIKTRIEILSKQVSYWTPRTLNGAFSRVEVLHKVLRIRSLACLRCVLNGGRGCV